MSNDHRFGERRPRALAAATRPAWPAGATVGIMLIAVACLGFSVTLYHLAGPRDIFAEEAAR